MKRLNYLILSALLALCASCGGQSPQAQEGMMNDSILAIREQGSFLIGGSIKTQPGTETRRPDPARRPRLCVLSNPSRCPQESARIPARSRTIRQDVGKHTRRTGRFFHPFPAPGIQHLLDRPASPGPRRTQHGGRNHQGNDR